MTGRELIPTAPPPLPGMPDDAIRDDVERLFEMIEEGSGGARLPALPSRALRARLEARAAELRRLLRPISGAMAEQEHAGSEVALMLLGFIGARTDIDNVALCAAYVKHLEDLPFFAIERACRDVVRRRPKDMKPDYVPSSARLHDMARVHVDPLATEAWRIQRILGVTKALPPPMAPEKAEEMRSKLTALAASIALKDAETAGVKDREERRRRDTAEQKGREMRDMLRQYEQLGVEPISSAGILISPELAAKTGALPLRAAARKRHLEKTRRAKR